MNKINNPSKRICFIIDSLNGGGAERVVLNLAQQLIKMNNTVSIVLIRDEVDYNIDIDYFGVHILSKNGKVSKLFNKFKLSRLLLDKVRELELQNGNFNLFVSHLEESDKVSKIARLPNLYHCYHGVMSSFVYNKYKNKTGIKRIYRKFKYSWQCKKQYNNTNIITVSDGVKNDLLQFGIIPKSIQTIYNPFDFNEIIKKSYEYNINEREYIVCVARFAKAKRHDVLIEAYVKSNISEKLILLGATDKPSDEENLKYIKTLIKKYNLESKINFQGFIANPYPWIKQAKCLVLSSEHEALPTVLIESLIIRTPVVSTNCPVGPAEILTNNLESFLSPVNDTDKLAKNIKNCVDNPPIISNRHIKKFDSKSIAQKYLELCNNDQV
jgi:glycosyltransferase involved in cell wall biosynthesis